MRITLTVLILALIYIFATSTVGGPVTVTQVSDRVSVMRVCDSPLCSNVIAVLSAQGIVVIDTSDRPSNARKIRREIEKIYYPNDIYCVINTHHVLDHIGGNEIFSDVPIIGHVNWISGMRSQDSLFTDPESEKKAKGILAEVEKELGQGGLGADRERLLTGILEYYEDFFDLYPGGFEITPPGLLFKDHMTFDLGDIEMNLFCPGHMYSTSDIFVYIPKEGILVTGDVFQEGRLPAIGAKSDIEGAIGLLEELFDEGGGIEMVIPGHMRILDVSEVRNQLGYLKKLRYAVIEAKMSGMSIEETKNHLSIEKEFSAYERYGRYSFYGLEADHARNIELMWNLVGRKL